jgi:beta-glucanase (GH16 family)
MTTSDWKLIWSDEFDGPAGSSPDPSKWQFNLGGNGWGNKEWEYYTDKPENASLDGDGSLVITAIELEDPKSTDLTCWYWPCRFTSARMLTQETFEFTYGRIEARIKVPYGQGIWPAFWMLGNDITTSGWPKSGEIDIMENIGREPSILHGTLHGPGYSGGNGITSSITLPEGQVFSDDFHIFALEWEADEIRWYLDGEQYASVAKDERFTDQKPWVYDHPFFIILNLAVGGAWPGYPDETTTFPQTMTVDYVRVYQPPE